MSAVVLSLCLKIRNKVRKHAKHIRHLFSYISLLWIWCLTNLVAPAIKNKSIQKKFIYLIGKRLTEFTVNFQISAGKLNCEKSEIYQLFKLTFSLYNNFFLSMNESK